MKKAIKGLLTLLLAPTLVATFMAGCGSSAPPAAATQAPATEQAADTQAADTQAAAAPAAIDTSKYVDLTMYLIGSPAVDYDAMVAEMNAQMKTDINANVNIVWIGWGDFSTKYPLVLASGESIDLLYTSNWLSYVKNASKGAFLALEDLAPVYAPKTWAAQTDDMKKTCTVGGHIYAMSPKFSQYGAMGYIVRGDLMDKMGLKAINSMDDFATYCDGVLKYAPELDPTGLDSQGTMEGYEQYELGYYGMSGIYDFPLMVKTDSNGMPQTTVVNYFDDPALPAFYLKMQDWYNKGYWPSNVLSNTDTNMLNEGKAATRLHNFDSWAQAYPNNLSWDLRFFPAIKHAVRTSAVQDAMAVGAHAANPERGLMLLELLRTDEKYYNWLAYGREGVDYSLNAEGKITALDSAVWGLEAYCNWGVKDPDFFKVRADYPPTYQDVIASVKSTGVDTPFVNFSFDPESVKTEVAAISAVMTKYHMPLALGYLPDTVKGLADLQSQLKTAGIDKVQAEMQKQVDAFFAAQ
jgi:putative aldouronate transport system substrate-binding protein